MVKLRFYRAHDAWWQEASEAAAAGDLANLARSFERQYEIGEHLELLANALVPLVGEVVGERVKPARSMRDLCQALDGVLFGAALLFKHAFLVFARDRESPLDGQPTKILLRILDQDADGLRRWLNSDDVAKFTNALEIEVARVPLAELSALASFAGETEIANWARRHMAESNVILVER